jgi:hypothetical protein
MTTTVLRPNGTNHVVIFGDPLIDNATVTGAASAHAAISDDSDSSYITGGYDYFDLGTFTLGTSVTKSLAVRARVGTASGTDTCGFAARISPSTTWTAQFQEQATSTTITNYAGAATPVTLTQSDIDALDMVVGVTIGATQGYSSLGSNRLYELYADLVYVEQPVTTVTAVSPDPYTASNIVPIAWTNSDLSDGGVQTCYEVKVFTSSQYSVSSFDPDTDTPVFETGDTLGGDGTVNVGPLSNGVTYRAYVRVAQTVNGVAHWSDWAFDTFGVDVDTADVDTILVAPQDALGRINITVTRDTGSEAWELIEIERSTDAGATWTPVRGSTYVDCTADANTYTAVDYETGNAQNVQYRARATRVVSGAAITGAWVTSTTVAWSSQRLWVKSPTDPALNRTFLLQSTISPTYAARRGVFPVIGAAVPVVVSDVRQRSVGTLSLHSEALDDTDDILALLNEAVLLIHPPPDWGYADIYVSLGDVTWRRRLKVFTEPSTWEAAFVEVDAPGDSTAGER